MPRGPRRYLRPVAERKSQPICVDVDRQLSDRLAGVEEVGDAGLPGGGADLLGGVDQAALGGDVGDRDELDRPAAVGEPAAQVVDGELAGLVVVDDLDDGAGARGDLEEGDDVAGVLGPCGQDPVAGREGEAVEGHVPGAGGVLDDRDLGGLAADEPGDGGVGVLDLVVRLRLRPRTRPSRPRGAGGRPRRR